MRDPDDPVLALLRELAQAHPGCDLSVVICPEDLGLNPKVSTLRQLMPRARYDLLVIADGDTLRPARITWPRWPRPSGSQGWAWWLPYRAGPNHTPGFDSGGPDHRRRFHPFGGRRQLRRIIRFALGATMALTRQALDAIGGLAPLADFLADDYQLGFRVAETGLQVKILPYVVETNNPGDRISGIIVAPASLGPHLPDLPPGGLSGLRHHPRPGL